MGFSQGGGTKPLSRQLLPALKSTGDQTEHQLFLSKIRVKKNVNEQCTNLSRALKEVSSLRYPSRGRNTNQVKPQWRPVINYEGELIQFLFFPLETHANNWQMRAHPGSDASCAYRRWGCSGFPQMSQVGRRTSQSGTQKLRGVRGCADRFIDN